MASLKQMSIIATATSALLMISLAPVFISAATAKPARAVNHDRLLRHQDETTALIEKRYRERAAKMTRKAVRKSHAKRRRVPVANNHRGRVGAAHRLRRPHLIQVGGRHQSRRHHNRRHNRHYRRHRRHHSYFSSRWLFHGPHVSFHASGRHALAWLGIAAVGLITFDHLTSRQRNTHATVYQRASTAPIGETIRWQDGNSSGAVTATRDGTSASGRYCREYQQTVTVNGRRESAYGVACRRSDGAWQMTSPSN